MLHLALAVWCVDASRALANVSRALYFSRCFFSFGAFFSTISGLLFCGRKASDIDTGRKEEEKREEDNKERGERSKRRGEGHFAELFLFGFQ